MSIRILGTGSYLPPKVVTNDDVARKLDTTDEWIYSHTGIHSRHVAGKDESTSTMAAEAGRAAMAAANVKPEEIGLIVLATSTPDYNPFPSTACIVQGMLGCTNAGAFDLQAACAGFVYALEQARGFVNFYPDKKALVIGAETLTRVLDWSDRSSCILFGDGAGAVVLGCDDPAGQASAKTTAHTNNMDAVDRVQENSNPFFALPLRGIGIATSFNVSDFYGTTSFASDCKVEVSLLQNEQVVIHALNPSKGIQEIWKKTAADILKIKKDNITIDSDYELSELSETPEDAINSISTVNELIKKACLEIEKKRFHNALPITVKKSQSAALKKNWDNQEFKGTKKILDEWCEFFFDLITEFEKKCPIGPNTNTLRREGYFAEFLFGAWLEYKGYKIKLIPLHKIKR